MVAFNYSAETPIRPGVELCQWQDHEGLEEGWRDQYADRASDMSEKMAPSLASAGAGVFLLVD